MNTIEAYKETVEKRVTIFMMNGYQINGTIIEVFDDRGLRVVDLKGHENIIPPHAISTIQKQ